MKCYKLSQVALAVALLFSAGTAMAEPGSFIINPTPVGPTLPDDLPTEGSFFIGDAWWSDYQTSEGFKEAIAQFGLTIEEMGNNSREMEARAKNPNDPLFWLKRTLETYPAHSPDHYNLPVAESNSVMGGRTTVQDRNNFFLTREYGKAGEAITIKTGEVPAGVICYAAMDGDLGLLRPTSNQSELKANGTTTYVLPHDGILLLGCKDTNKHMKNLDTYVPVQILQGGSQRHPLFIFGANSQRDWVDFTQQTMPSGYGIFFDGRSRYVASQERLARSTDTNILKTLRENLTRTINYDKVNGLDGSSDLHQPPRSLFMVSYDACCWAGGGAGRVAIGRYKTIPNIGNWATWHEYGHHYQMGWSWGGLTEVTVNLYSLAACYKEWGYAALNECHKKAPELGFSWDQQAVGSVIKAGQRWDIATDRDLSRRLNMFGQLLASYPDLYPALGKAYRDLYNRGANKAMLDENQEKIDWFAVNASRLSGYDLREFFDLWTLSYSAEAREQIAAMKLPQPAQPVATYETTLTHTGSTPTTAKLVIKDNLGSKGIAFITNSDKVGPRSLVWTGDRDTRLHTQVVDTQNRAYNVTLRGTRSMGGCAGHAVNAAVVCGSSDPSIYLSVSYHPEDNTHLPGGEYNGTLPLIAAQWKNPAWSANVNIPLTISK